MKRNSILRRLHDRALTSTETQGTMEEEGGKETGGSVGKGGAEKMISSEQNCSVTQHLMQYAVFQDICLLRAGISIDGSSTLGLHSRSKNARTLQSLQEIALYDQMQSSILPFIGRNF